MGDLYDKDYYFIRRENDERRPSMTPDEDTVNLPFTHKALPFGGRPLKFFNGAYERQRKRGTIPADTPPDILFYGSNFLVKDDLRDRLLLFDIPDLYMHSSIYVDHKDFWHENYWFLTFTERFDCWDRDLSEILDEPDEDEDDYEVLTYSLNDALLDETPLEKRRFFQMGGTSADMIVVHYSIGVLFQRSGAVLVPIRDYNVTFFG